MKIGFIGLGKMGKNMVLRIAKAGKKVVAYNRHPEPVKEVMKAGAEGAFSLKEFVSKLDSPKIVWVMVTSSAVDEIFEELVPLLSKGDIIVDGGNSNYHLTLARNEMLKKKGINFMDAGVSGGLVAAKLGYCIMAGGDKEVFKKVEPFIKAASVSEGYLHTGPVGSGHYVKMIHNAIEYGMMQAIGEGFELLEKGPYKDLDYHKISHLWNNGSIVRGLLMEMTESAFSKDSKLSKISGYIADNGEGKWAVQEAMDFNVPFAVNSFALFERYRSRENDTMSDKLVAAIRDEFGGHGVKSKGKGKKD